MLLGGVKAQGQLVADGQTNVLAGVATNFAGGVTIGTNGVLTLLVVTNGSTVGSGGTVVIGYNALAQSNRVVVTGTGSSLTGSSIFSGQNGSANELDILNGAAVSGGGTIGNSSSSGNNLVLISDTGSVWNNGGTFSVGANGPFNRLIVTNGGQLWANNPTIGRSPSSASNSVVITGSGSAWNNSGYFYLGYSSPGHNQLSIRNGGNFITSSTCDIGVYCNSNVLTVADTNSSLQCQTYRMGYSSLGNQCIVSNGASLSMILSSQAATVEGTFTTAAIIGGGSVWTNAGDFDFGQYSNVLFVTSGGHLVDNNGYIQGNVSSPPKTNSVIVAGTNSLWKNFGDLHIADISAQLLITNAGKVSDINGYLGDAVGHSNCFVMISGQGSVWTNASSLYVGNNGAHNQLIVSNSGLAIANSIYVGGAQGTANGSQMLVSDSSKALATGAFYIGDGTAANQLIVSNYGMVTAPTIYIGVNNGMRNQLTVLNTGLVAASTLYVGSSSPSNQLTVTSSGAVTANNLYVGYTTFGSQMIVSNSGTVTVTNQLQLNGAVSSTSLIVINGGTVVSSNSAQLGTSGGHTGFIINSGFFSANNFSVGSGCNFIFNGGTVQAGSTTYGNASPLVVGDGVDMAWYQLLNTGTHAFAGGINISSNATLAGAGTVSGNVSVGNGGTLIPGNTNSSLFTLNGNLVLSNGSTTMMTLTNLGLGFASANQITGLTNVTYGGTLQMTNSGLLTGSIYSFKLFVASNYSGAFSSITPPVPPSALYLPLRWDTNELNVDGVLRIFRAVTAPPVISSTTVSGGNLIISAGSGIAYDACYLLTSTNLSAPLTDWSCVTTNYFDASGTTSFTNTISVDEPSRYFLLQVN